MVQRISEEFLDGIYEVYSTLMTDQIFLKLLDEENTDTNVYDETPKKVYLEPNESISVDFEITEPMLRLWNSKNELVSENGEFTVSVGYADHFAFTEKFELVCS